MIRIAKPEDINMITKLLCEAFDIDDDINDVLSMISPLENTFVYENEGEVISIASAIPFTSGDKKGRYIYAVTTDINHRGKGYAGAMLEHIINYFSGKVDVVMLKPAEKSLFDFYRNNGFDDEICADVKEIVFNGNDVPEKISFEEYKEERKKYTDFAFPENVMEYYFDAYEYCALKGDDYLVLYRKLQNRCVIDEIYGDFYKINPAIFEGLSCEAVLEGKEVYALAHFYGGKFNINFRVPME